MAAAEQRTTRARERGLGNIKFCEPRKELSQSFDALALEVLMAGDFQGQDVLSLCNVCLVQYLVG